MSEIHGAVGSYVVHALDDDEMREFEAHLEQCEECHIEARELSESASQLATLTETEPPPALRSSILSAIHEVRQLPPEMPADQPPTDVKTLPRRAAVASPLELAEPTAGTTAPVAVPVDELAVRRQRRSSRLMALAVAAALVVAVSFGGWAVNLRQERQAQVAEATLETQLYAAPDVKVLPTTLKNGAAGSFAYSRSLNKALFVGPDVPAAGAGHTYQLWTAVGKSLVPNRTFAGGGLTRAWFTGDVSDAGGLALSIEHGSGATGGPTDVQAQIST